jgi:hypothetical protein
MSGHCCICEGDVMYCTKHNPLTEPVSYIKEAEAWLKQNIGAFPASFTGRERVPFAHEVYSLAGLLEYVAKGGRIAN